MKHTVVTASLVPVLTLAAVAPFAALDSFPGLNPIALVGGLVAMGVLAFALRDYSSKPAFRARRASPRSANATPATSRTPVAGSCDWTYSTRAA